MFELLWMVVLPQIVQGAAFPCSLHGQTRHIITIDASHRWGTLFTPGFPNDLNLPLRCSWMLDNSYFHRLKRVDDWTLYIYLTQVYVYPEFFSIRECKDSAGTNCTSPEHLTRNATYRYFQTPYLLIDLDVPKLPSVHFRVVEVHDVYGVNMTFETARPEDKKDMFVCSLVECHLNGECIALSDGHEVTDMECRCRRPLDDTVVSEKPFYGDKCQYHNKHGHCTGPGDRHSDANKRCNGHPCAYLSSRYVRCTCPANVYGRSCELKGAPSTAANCSQEVLATVTLDLVVGNIEPSEVTQELHLFWNNSCHKCSVKNVSLESISSAKSRATVHVSGLWSRISKALASAERSRQLTDKLILRSAKVIDQNPLICIKQLSINKENPVHQSDEFMVTCVVEGTRDMEVEWHKDNYMLDVSLADRYMKSVVGQPSRGEAGLIESRTVVLQITKARELDSGLFRCTARDGEVEVSREVDPPLIVTQPPRLEIHPQVLVLEEENGRIVTPRSQATIFCLIRDRMGKEYKFQWSKREEWSNSKPKVLNPATDPEVVEDLMFPAGILMRLDKVKRDTIYTCSAFHGYVNTQVQANVYVIPRKDKRRLTCKATQDQIVKWPVTKINTEYRRACSEDGIGLMSRRCDEYPGYEGVWSSVKNNDQCIIAEYLDIKKSFDRYRSGYVLPLETEEQGTNGDRNIAVAVVKQVLAQCQKQAPRLAEWNLILNLLTHTLNYLACSGKEGPVRPANKQSACRTRFSRQINDVKKEFFDLIKCIYSIDNRKLINDKSLDVLNLIRLVAHPMGRALNSTHPVLKSEFCPYGTVVLTRLQLNKANDSPVLLSSQEESSSNAGPQPSPVQTCLDYDSFVQVRLVSTSRNAAQAAAPMAEDFIVRVIYFQPLHDLYNAAAEGQPFELNSHPVIVEWEKEVWDISPLNGTLNADKMADLSGLQYVPEDTLGAGDGYELTIRFAYMNRTFNVTERPIICGELGPSLSMASERSVSPKFVPSSNCRLRFVAPNGSLVMQPPAETFHQYYPECVCRRSGTYGLLLPVMLTGDGMRVVVTGSGPVVYGCLTGLVLSSLTWCLLLKTYYKHHTNFITLLKIITAISVSVSNLAFILCFNEILSSRWSHVTSPILQTSLLTGLSCQLGIASLILLHQRPHYLPLPANHLSLARLAITLVSCLGPGLVVGAVSAVCGPVDSWWLKTGTGQFACFVALNGILFGLIVVAHNLAWLAVKSDPVGLEARGAGQSPAKVVPACKNIGILQRSGGVSMALLVYNAILLLYFNSTAKAGQVSRLPVTLISDFKTTEEDESISTIQVLFGLASSCLGFTVLLLYILRSEAYIIVGCGSNKHDAWNKDHHEIEFHPRKCIGSGGESTSDYRPSTSGGRYVGSDSGGSRSTISSAREGSRGSTCGAAKRGDYQSSRRLSGQKSEGISGQGKGSPQQPHLPQGSVIGSPVLEEAEWAADGECRTCRQRQPPTMRMPGLVSPAMGGGPRSVPEPRQPPRARCYIQDDPSVSLRAWTRCGTEVLADKKTKGGFDAVPAPPEPLADFLDRVKKNQLPGLRPECGQLAPLKAAVQESDTARSFRAETDVVAPEETSRTMKSQGEWVGTDMSEYVQQDSIRHLGVDSLPYRRLLSIVSPTRSTPPSPMASATMVGDGRSCVAAEEAPEKNVNYLNWENGRRRRFYLRGGGGKEGEEEMTSTSPLLRTYRRTTSLNTLQTPNQISGSEEASS